jgi:hypothetical protein
MRRALLILALLSPLHAAVTLSFLGATQTQALVAIRGASGPCNLALSESASYSPVIPDVDGARYNGASTDLSRADTLVWSDGTRVVTLGHQTGDRALGVLTAYYLQVSNCGGSATLTFTTPNITAGTTQGWPPPFDDKQWGNRAWPFGPADLLTKTRHIDPLTGVSIYPASNALDWTARYPGGGQNPVAPGTLNFAYWDGGVGWTNPGSVLSGAGSAASTTNTNPIDLYPSADVGLLYPYFQWSLNDVGVKLFGSGVPFTVCVFLNPTAGCIGTPFTVTPTAGSGVPVIASAGTDPDTPWPGSFPCAFFCGWGSNVFVPVENRLTQGTLAAVNGALTIDGTPTAASHFSTSLQPGNKIYIAGSAPACANNLCTLVSLQSTNKATIAENITVASGTAYAAMGFGIRIQKTAAAGSLNLGAAYKLAGSVNVNNQRGAENVRCGAETFATGDTPPKQAHLCTVPVTYAGFNMWYFLMTDGTARPFHAGRVPSAAYFTSLGWNANDNPAFTTLCCTMEYAPAVDARTWYVYGPNSAGGRDLYAMHYDGDTTENRDWHYTMSVSGDSYIQYQPSDKVTWSVVMGYGATLIGQIAQLYPSYDPQMYGNNFTFVGTSGDTAYFENNYNNTQDLPAWIAVVDLSSGVGVLTNLIHTMDGTGVNGAIKFGGVHNVGPMAEVPDTAQISNHILNSNNTSLLHGGPFQVPITHVKKQGLWSTDTSLPWPINSSYDSACPVGNPFEINGAVGNQCFTFAMPHGGWCNVAPRADEKAKWPCPAPSASIPGWAPSNYAQPFPARVGDVFVDATMPGGYSYVPGDNENFRIVQITPGAGPNGEDLVVAQRNSICEYCCIAPGPVAGSTCSDNPQQNTHLSGWMPLASAVRFNGCSTGAFIVSGKTSAATIGDLGRSYLQGHGDLIKGTIPGTAAYVSAGGATPQKTVGTLLDVPVSISPLVPPTFHGTSLPLGAGVQAYSISPGQVPWMLDTNSINNNYGDGRENMASIPNPRTLTATSTPNVYKIQVLGTLDYKVHPLIGWAGKNNLKDISGPSSDVTATPYTMCYALNSGECYTGSAAGEVYINVPAAYDWGNCSVAQHWANVPCVISGWPGAGGFRQQGWTAADPTSTATRFLSYLFDIPGGQYAYNTFWPLDSSVAWGPPTFEAGWGQVTWLVRLPPWPVLFNNDHSTEASRNDFLMNQETSIRIPPGLVYAEVQFGYSRWTGPTGNPASFQCTPRAEGCNTSGQPYNFESQSRILTSCGTGCSINLPVAAPNVVYYRLRRSTDGINWTTDDNILALAIP